MARQLGWNRRLAVRLVLGAQLMLAGTLPAFAGGTAILVGPGFGPLRQPPRKVFGSLEVDHEFATGPLGFWASFDGGNVDKFFGVGLLLAMPLGRGWRIAISSGPGWYSNVRPFNLGNSLEFRSSLYVLRRLSTHLSAGLSVSHYSNAGTAIHNPGAETVRLLLSVPLHL
jgi:hypothetical protein